MIKKVLATIKENQLIQKGDRIVVAVSGGADSVALLEILHSLQKVLDIQLEICHLNHQLRGEEATRDSDFVQALARKMRLVFHMQEAQNLKQVTKAHSKSEQWGRELRYHFFTAVALARNAKVATAHSLSDSVETTFFNIIRGTGAVGGAGIQAKKLYTTGENKKNIEIIRPLIECTSKEIREYLAQNNIEYIIDSSNLTNDYSRNFLRNEVLPNFSRINSSYENAVNRFQKHILEQAKFIETYVDDFFCKNNFDVGVDVKTTQQLPKVVVENIARRLVYAQKEPTEKLIMLVCAVLLGEQKAASIAKGKTLCRSGNKIIFAKKQLPQIKDEISIKAALLKGVVHFNNRYYIEFSVINKEKYMQISKTDQNLLLYFADCDTINIDTFILRGKKQGDNIRLPKRAVTKSLKKLFCEMKLPMENREIYPVIANENEVCFVHKIGFIDRVNISEKTKEILMVKVDEREIYNG